MNILGLHSGVTANQHDPAAALIIDGTIVGVYEEERFCRVKSPRGTLPIRSTSNLLKDNNLTMQDIDLVVHSGVTFGDLLPRLERFLRHYFGHVPKIEMVNHQTAHLASAYYCSGYDEAMCISWDGYGDGLSNQFGVGKAGKLNILDSYPADQSIGQFYTSITSFLGFKPDEDEYKVMGLASFGTPEYDLSSLARPSDNGYIVNREIFEASPKIMCSFEPAYNHVHTQLLGEHRTIVEPITQRHMNIAASAQKALEDCLVSLVTKLHKDTGLRKLCIAGGVALNCSANKVIYELPFIDELFVQPASSDRGLALGCAILGAVEEGYTDFTLEHAYYGPSYSNDELEKSLQLVGIPYTEVAYPTEEAAKRLAQGQILGWMQGRSEFGPRALGHRSILADPSSPTMKDKINARIKFREEFRPFAPAVMAEEAKNLFEMNQLSPFMTITFNVKEEWQKKIPAVNHVNNTARVQTVAKMDNSNFHQLISDFNNITGVPTVLNTSYNVMGQPIVETAKDALTTFASSGMDATFIGPFLVNKDKL
ncbi:carbamoyltransferase C-terminal domain-containing protein [Alteromonas sp. KUL49]|uniref:carbamoyltransferase family protein n=1 Tax=Alteromonas sp. KUL49 TaxID=2480798 RepID=UPI0010FFB9FE|nr:carbamoyltransferase C-terminal domain-containing protein [Alteromonas sp. KUL49]GEA11678.1 carbamoyltransferase [Alteromonas sp. KUL49]